MAPKEIVSVAAIIFIIGVFVSSSALVNPLLAQSSPAKASTSTAKANYKDFQMCLLRARGQKVMRQNKKLNSAMAKFIAHPQVQDQAVVALFLRVGVTVNRNKEQINKKQCVKLHNNL